MRITVAGAGYVGLSLSTLLAQRHSVTAITVVQEEADKINKLESPIQDDEIERFFSEARKGERALDLVCTTDRKKAYENADLVIVATPTNYDDVDQSFDTSAVEDAIERALEVNQNALIVIKSTIPVGYTESVREKYGTERILIRF